jgi:alkanesulfonate monooxygenase SsuD/methylene tetrahydromethanopterin reductase-like flavin-dependent oxidoreductase (luciferase family)
MKYVLSCALCGLLIALTAPGALAQATRRIRIGCMVNGMHYRHPAVTANMAATLDIISGGRLDLGMGAGWNLQKSSYRKLRLIPDEVAALLRSLGFAVTPFAGSGRMTKISAMKPD